MIDYSNIRPIDVMVQGVGSYCCSTMPKCSNDKKSVLGFSSPLTRVGILMTHKMFRFTSRSLSAVSLKLFVDLLEF